MTTPSSRDRFIDFRRRQLRAPELERRTIRARGLNFAVWISPDVPGRAPLLVVNGGMLYGHDLLWPAMSPLAAGRQVILYDQRGRGESGVPPGAGASRIEHDAGDIPALREALGILRWDLLGHSWGGGIAMLAAERDPGGTRRLVLVDSVGPTSAWIDGLHERGLARMGGTQHAALEPLDPMALRNPDPGFHSTYSRAFYPAWFGDPQFAQGFTPPRASSATGTAISARLRREGYDWSELIRAIKAPALVIHGDLDPLPADEAVRLAGLIEGARLELVHGSGHMPFWEAPEAFFALVESFLTND